MALESEEKDDIRDLLDRICRLPPDTKADALQKELQRLRADGYHQAMVFMQFTDTIDFLRNQIAGDSGTGLESPVVFVCGVDGLFEKEYALDVAGDGRSELVRDNTRRIYLAMTRASRKLILTYRRPATLRCLEGPSKQHTPCTPILLSGEFVASEPEFMCYSAPATSAN